jgi:glycosyltransferase involved in cell wall biosynthesis
MRILIYTHAFAPKVGGVETIVMALASGLARIDGAGGLAGTDLTVATPTPPGSFDDRSLPFHVLRGPRLLELARLIRNADIVHIAGPAFAPLLLGLILRKPVVVEHHGFQTICPNGQLLHEPTRTECPGHFMGGRHRECIRCNARAGSFNSVKLWLLTFARRWLCTRVRSNITPTNWIAGLLHLPRMTTIHHGITVDVVGNLPTDSSPRVVTFVGRLVGTKGIDVLLRAAARVKAEGSNITLRIIGNGPERPRLEAQSQALGLADCVNFLGYQPDLKLCEALEGVGIIVVPSLAGEVFGLVALENMARGIVPIVPSGGALAEVIGDAGLTFAPGDDEALAGCLRRALKEPNLAALLSDKARQRARQRFNEERMVGQHVVLYHQLAADRASGVPAREAIQ